MPLLPGGLHVSLCVSPAIEGLKKGDFSLQLSFFMAVRSVDDIKGMVSILYYRGVDANGLPIDPYVSGLSLEDIELRKTDWSEEDYAAFAKWQQSEPVKNWMDGSYEEIYETVKNLKTELPKNLHGIFE
jgi:hypothetical protein